MQSPVPAWSSQAPPIQQDMPIGLTSYTYQHVGFSGMYLWRQKHYRQRKIPKENFPITVTEKRIFGNI